MDQLPPVGPGTVLSAAIESKAIPVVDLRDIFRQAHQSNIVKAAHSVQQGLFPTLAEVNPDKLQVNHLYIQILSAIVSNLSEDLLDISLFLPYGYLVKRGSDCSQILYKECTCMSFAEMLE